MPQFQVIPVRRQFGGLVILNLGHSVTLFWIEQGEKHGSATRSTKALW
jgi:hypothetical protein